MRKQLSARWLVLGCLLMVGGAGNVLGQSLTGRVLISGLQEPTGAAVHPISGDVYVSEQANGRIVALKNGKADPALAADFAISNVLPRWAISSQMPTESWMDAQLHQPGPLTFSTNGNLFVAEQIPNGRILELFPNEQGLFSTAVCVPVPWLDQEFQWRNIFVDTIGRLFIVGADEIGGDFMKFGSALMREANGNWWVIDFGPFANFGAIALSERLDVLLVGDRTKGNLSWWEVDRHMMLGGAPDVLGRATMAALAVYPDGSFIIGAQEGPGKASLRRYEPFTGQQHTLASDLTSLGAIAMDRPNARYIVTDPAAGKVVEYTPPAGLKFNESVMRQIVRSVEGMIGMPSEAPAFLNNFFERLQDAAKDILPDDSTHAVDFNLSDIAGKMPVVAGRVRATVEVEGAEDDPIQSVEFFLLFPSKVVLTESAVSPSLSFFSARRKSGKLEQTRPVFQGNVGVYRMSGTNYAQVASAEGGLHIPIVVCGMDQADGGVYVNLSFLGAGIYGDYYLTLFQGPREQKAKLVVKSVETASGNVTYEASFMDDAVIEGMQGSTISKEQYSNLLISGFAAGGGANRSVGWLRLGQFPAQMTIAFGDSAMDAEVTSAQSGLKEIVEKKRVEMSLDAAEDIVGVEGTTAPSATTGEPAP